MKKCQITHGNYIKKWATKRSDSDLAVKHSPVGKLFKHLDTEQFAQSFLLRIHQIAGLSVHFACLQMTTPADKRGKSLSGTQRFALVLGHKSSFAQLIQRDTLWFVTTTEV